MKAHNIIFKPCESSDAVIDVVCTCGVKLAATNGTDAMKVAREHIANMQPKAQGSDDITRELSEA